MIDAPRPAAGTNAQLRLMATTDLHMHLTSFDYYADRPDPTVGLTRTASLIAQARKEARNAGALSLLFDNGDGLQGTPMGDLAIGHPGRPHPLMQAFGQLRYDAVGLGNHDFNFGLRALDSALRHAPCPVLASNIHKVGQYESVGFSSFAILDRIVETEDSEWPIRIGVVSFLPPQTLQWDAHLLAGKLEVDDIPDSARFWVPKLRASGCDLIVALAHSGLGQDQEQPKMENAVIPLAAVDGIDAIVAGHTHLHVPDNQLAAMAPVESDIGKIHGKPVVMAGAAGSHLGIIDLTVTASDSGRWRATESTVHLWSISGAETGSNAVRTAQEDPDLVEVLAEDHAETRKLMSQPVGHSSYSLHSYFTFFAPDRALALVAAAQAAAVRPHLAENDMTVGLPLLSATAPGKFGARSGPLHYTDVPAGPLSLRHVADLQIFPNELRAVIVTGAQILDWLEMSASLFNKIRLGSEGSDLLDPALPGHDFDVVHGLSWQIDLSADAMFDANGRLRAPDSRRIHQLRWYGRPVQPDQRFVVALNSHRAAGGGRVSTLHAAEQVPLPKIAVRSAVKRYVSGRLQTDPLELAGQPWRFSPMPGTRVMVETGPGAAAYLNELDDRDVISEGLGANGFLRLNLGLE